MWLTVKTTICVLVLLIAGTKASTKLDAHYVAGVVEFRPVVSGMTSADMVTEHLAAYLEIIDSVQSNATDILVFPEATLNNVLQRTYVPDPSKELVAPCDDSAAQHFQQFLVSLSCAALATRKYIVINVKEKENCPSSVEDTRPCSPSGLNVYNTNVVFDRQGRVISRYRKVNLYGEPLANATLQPELGIFDTDFGVRFGHFICFDILFHTPSQDLIKKYGITDFIFPSYWFSELPFLSALQLQQSWAWGNNINILAAGASFPATGTTGSGIFAGKRGEITALLARGTGERRLLVAEVPKIQLKTETNVKSKKKSKIFLEKSIPELRRMSPKDIRLMRDPNIEQFNSVLVRFNPTLHRTQELKHEICANGHCCQFEVILRALTPQEDTSHYFYRLGVFNDKRRYEEEVWTHLRVCSIYGCLNESVTSCGYLLPDNVNWKPSFIFESIRIDGDFEKSDRLLIMPNSLTDTLHGLTARQMEFTIDERRKSTKACLTLKRELDNLLTFGIYANYYDRSAAKQRDISMTLLLCALLIVFIRGFQWLNKRK